MFSSSLLSCIGRVVPDASKVFLELILSLPMLWAPTLWPPMLCSEEHSLPEILVETLRLLKHIKIVISTVKILLIGLFFKDFNCQVRQNISMTFLWQLERQSRYLTEIQHRISTAMSGKWNKQFWWCLLRYLTHPPMLAETLEVPFMYNQGQFLTV